MANDKKIIINSEEGEIRVAFLEDGAMSGFLMEREESEKVVGNIYKGVVKNILSGIEAAFVDIGLGKNGFLHFSDIESGGDDEDIEDENAPADEPRLAGEGENPQQAQQGGGRNRHRHPRRRNHNHSVKVGDEILVQVVKEQIGDKGVRLTTNISLPGRYIVFLPHSNLKGISKRISNSSDRDQLRTILREITMPKDMGLIVRTVSKGCNRDTIMQEVKYLYKIWRTIKISQMRAKAPAKLFANLPLSLQVVRDSLTEDISEVVVDDLTEHKNILRFVNASFPAYKNKIKLYREKMPIFSHYNLRAEIEKSLQRKLWIKGGGYLFFDRTEALVAIDVNSGRSSGSRNNPDETILRTNIEAAKEIARQLQIRNIGGIIIVDFIDMHKVEHRKRLMQVFQSALAQDKAKIKIYPISKLGLVEMTRQRVKETIGSEIYERCTHCDGLGVVKSIRSVWLDLLRDLKEIGASTKEKRLRIVFSNKMLNAEILNRMHVLKKLEKDYSLRVALEPSDEVASTEYEIYSMATNNKLR